ncbi:cyclase family protein [Desulfovibrio sulfodismutans]|uniref:Cyclase family protein n=1 Tax=Desulfolutivibrio sulfodismutans TaxID=63561 RepID=A0A7K3NTC5_9BACT|nr:cyclase family protein [Desulfolutivibrio sulfodismutans]NDY58509.1 cyclase family protein [Desulfolutivibrio sulfodismutans]
MLHDLSLPLRAGIEESVQSEANVTRLVASGHVGTHLDRILGTVVPLDYFKSRGVRFDVRAFCREREIRPEDVDMAFVRPGDFVMFHTGYMARSGYGTPDYLQAHVAVSWDLVDRLLERKVHYIGIDARGLRPNAEHRQVDERCERMGTYVVENMTNLEALPAKEKMMVYTMCFDAGGTGIACRVIAETADEASSG